MAMTPTPFKPVLSIVCVGEGAVAVLVRRSPLGRLDARRLGCVERLDPADPARAAATLRDAIGPARLPGPASKPGAGVSVVLTLPAGAAALRPIAMSRREFDAAKPELAAAADELFPFLAADADLGFIELAHDPDAPAAPPPSPPEDDAAARPQPRGVLLAAPAARVEPLLNAVRTALPGARNIAVLTHEMALPALGLQHLPRARVLERSPLGVDLLHHLRFGRPVELAVPPRDDTDADAADAVLPTDPIHHAAAATDVAIAAALVARLAPAVVAPLRGRPAPQAARFAAAAALLAAAAVLAIAAFEIADARFDAAADRLVAQQAAIADAFDQADEARRELQRLTALIQGTRARGAGPDHADDPALLLAFTAAHATVPEPGYLSALRLGPDAVRLSGAAPRAQTVLQRLESSPFFAGARPVTAYGRIESPNGDDDWETFELVAERVRPTEPPSDAPSADPRGLGEERSSSGGGRS